MSPWENVPIGKNAPESINVVIEIPRGSQNKYEFDEKLGLFKLDRVQYSAFYYPLDYGFIPETRSEDGDHLDALILGGEPLFPGCIVEARVIGMLHMIDSGEPDAKILAVQAQNMSFDTIKDIKDIETYQPHLLKQIVHFYEHLKDLKGKKVECKGWDGIEAAKAEIKKAQEVYAKEKGGQ